MRKLKDKAFVLAFVFSLICIMAAIALKAYGVNWFDLNGYAEKHSIIIETIARSVVLIAQYILIVGCVTRYELRPLVTKMLPFIPLISILYYLPLEAYSILSILILFVPCISFIPKFSTVIRFIINIIIIAILQLIIIWLRLDLKAFEPVFPPAVKFLIMNIDQIIMLALLYYINRKRGDKYGFHFFR